MANKFNWFFEQLVTEAELDEAFENIETSIQNLVADQSYSGVYLGMGVTEATVPDLTVDIAGGRAYDDSGQRIFIPTTQNLDVSVDSNASSTAVVTPGNEKWVSVFVRFVRANSDQRFDGNGSPVFFRRDESFEFNVVQGAEALIGTASRPALIAGEILIADINLVNAQTQIFDADIESDDTATDPNSRFQYAFNLTSSSPAEIRVGPLPDAMQAILTELNNHIANVANPHPATAITFDAANLPIPGGWTNAAAAAEVQAAIDGVVADLGAPAGGGLVGANIAATWADATTVAGSTVDAAIEEIVTDLAATATADGAQKIGFDNTASGLTASNVAAAIDELTSEKGNLAGGNTWTGTQTISNTLSTDGTLDINGAMSREDPDHNFANMLAEWHEHSEQYVGATATQTDDVTLFFDTAAAAGIIEGTVMVWTDNSNDSFVCSAFVIPFTKLASSTPELDNGSNFFKEVGGAGTTTLQGALPTSVTLQIISSSNTISYRTLHNAGPTDRNVIIMWRVLHGNLDQ